MEAKDIGTAALGKSGLEPFPILGERLKNIGNFKAGVRLLKFIQDGSYYRLGFPKTPPGESLALGFLEKLEAKIDSRNKEADDD